MDQRGRILKYLKERGTAPGRELLEMLGISRQALNKHMKRLIQEGDVVKLGSTRGAVYTVSGTTRPERRLRRRYVLDHLEEDGVFREIDLYLNLGKGLRENVLTIVRYVFTEILNNAIEHSHSEFCDVEVNLDQYSFGFKIRDYGIGIFNSVYTKYDLPDETWAVGELVKGKITTMRERHSGEGVFFSSKAGDKVAFRSHRIDLLFDNRKEDVFVEDRRYIGGTEVRFEVGRRTRRRLEEIFRLYAPEEFGHKFEKTRVFVKLFQCEYVSRSEARRLLSGLDKFREIILDFKGVRSIGQGFADEVFRVFKRREPGIVIRTENLSPAVEAMIGHVVDY